jgi:hypothetical protein
MDDIIDNGTGGKPDPFANLDAIADEAAREEAEKGAAAQRAVEQEQADAARQEVEIWALIPKQIGTILGMALPELKTVYTDEACHQWGAGMAAVSQKYGWDAADTLAKFAPELALASATIPLAVPTYFAIRKRLDAAEEKRARQVQQPQQPMTDLNAAPTPAGQQAPGNFSEPQ